MGIMAMRSMVRMSAMVDYRKRHKRYNRLTSQLNFAAKGDVSQLVDINDIAQGTATPSSSV